MEALLLQPNILLHIAFLCFAVGILLFVYSINHSPKAHEDKPEETARRYHKIINNAHNEARAILDTTSLASVNILSESKATNEHLTEQLDKVLQQIAAQHIAHMKQATDEFTKSYDEKLTALQEQLKNHTEQSIKESEERMNQTLEKYMQPIAQRTSSSHELIDQRTQEMISKVEKELTDYKTARIQKIESEVQGLVKKTYQEVLHQSLPEHTQEELIMKSLDKAKIEGGLSI